MKGFIINGLYVEGNNVPVKCVTFNTGLNIITGPSDTGKTYIFESIDYMLGSSIAPKKITVDAPYKTMYLEIEHSETKKKFTIARSMTEPETNITIYESNYNNIKSVSGEEIYYKSDKTKANISSFLLEKCGFKLPIKTRIHTSYKKQNFTFRNFIPYTMISETRMISDHSPIYHSNGQGDRTKYLYQFKYLVTNNDDSEIEEKTTKNVFDAAKKSNLKLLQELIKDEKNSEEEVSKKIAISAEELDDTPVLLLLKIVQKEIADRNREISNLEFTKNEELLNLKYNETVLERFHLLKEQYFSDIERLLFIEEGSFLINQLVMNQCPHCGEDLDSSHINCEEIDLETISISCEYEISQIKLKINELQSSIDTTKQMIEDCQEKMAAIQVKIDYNCLKLEKQLTPELNLINEKIVNISNIEKMKSELAMIQSKISQYDSLIKDYKLKKHVSYSSPNQAALSIIEDTSFLKILKDTINNALYTTDKNIEAELFFNKYKELDFSIDGENRISRGKGSRALLASVFFLAVRNYCKEKNYPYSNFLILDSPINAFKDLKENEKLSSSFKNNFLRYLAVELHSTQTIVIENIDILDIDKEVIDKINIIEFTKSSHGRYGFY